MSLGRIVIRVVGWTNVGVVGTFAVTMVASRRVDASAYMAALSVIPWVSISLLSATAAFVPPRGLSFALCQLLIGSTFVAAYFITYYGSAAGPASPSIPMSLRVWAPLLVFATLLVIGFWRSRLRKGAGVAA